MSGACQAHDAVAFNLIAVLHAALRGTPCRGSTSDRRVFVPDNAAFAYPDISIVCGTPEFADAAVDTLRNPIVLIEISSPSTAYYDHDAKFIKHCRLPSGRESVRVHQNERHVEQFERVGDFWGFGGKRGRDRTTRAGKRGHCGALRGFLRERRVCA